LLISYSVIILLSPFWSIKKYFSIHQQSTRNVWYSLKRYYGPKQGSTHDREVRRLDHILWRQNLQSASVHFVSCIHLFWGCMWGEFHRMWSASVSLFIWDYWLEESSRNPRRLQ
jgi:hypothetical protein